MPDLNSKIIKADVFRSGAQIVRTGQAELSAGLNTLYVHGMSASASSDTARIYSQEGVSCSNLRFVDLRDEDLETPETISVKEQIELIKKRIEIKELQTELWKTNGDFSGKDSQPLSEISEYIEKLPERIEGLVKDIAELKKEQKKLEKQLAELSKKAELTVMAADIEVPAAGSYAFEVRYFERAASWRPLYEVRSEGEGPLEIRMRANISQNTYEDWKGIALSLFTGDPSLAGTVPELMPLYLDIRQPVVYAKSAAAFGRARSNDAFMVEEATVCDMDAPMAFAGAAPNVLMSMQEAAVSEDETSTEYALPGSRDVFRTGEGTVTDLQSYTVPAEYRVVTVPSMDQRAYLVVAVKPSDLPLHSAIQPSVYVKGVYTGTIWLDPDLTKDEIEITLGEKERVHVSRNEVTRKTSTALLKGTKTVEYGYETRISNETGSDLTIIVKDQIPVSENKDITVEALELSGAKPDAENGLLCWKLDIPAGGSGLLKLGYKVSRPKDKNIAEERRPV